MAEHLPPPPASAPAALQPDLSLPQGLAYGLMGLPLAFVALPLYVVLPHHYASTLGAPLAALGGVLLGARLLDALVDPGLGRRLADAGAVGRVHAPGAPPGGLAGLGCRGPGPGLPGLQPAEHHPPGLGGPAGRQ